MRAYMNVRIKGFTLIEMIMVMALTAILGGVVAMVIGWPIQGYIDSARRMGMGDIADIAISRITRDLRTALPNSVRISQVGGVYYLEFIPTTGGGRYRAASDVAAASPPCGSAASAVLDFSPVADTCFEVLGPMPTLPAGDWVVVNNASGVNVYTGTDRAQIVSAVPPAVTVSDPVTMPMGFPSASPGSRFQVISTPVSYVCDPGAGTLTRYWGYAIANPQPTALATLASVNAGALLATGVSACKFSTKMVQSSEMASLQLTITENGESISLYVEAHVVNVP